MCLYSKQKQSRIAKNDIKCIKYLRKSSQGYVTPYQNTPVKLNSVLIPSEKDVDIQNYTVDACNNNIVEINGGVIHAMLVPKDFANCIGFIAIVKAGTEYWITPYGDQICAKELYITDTLYNGEKWNSSFIEEILSQAPEVDGIKVGDYVSKDGDYFHSNETLPKDIIGRVVGFNKNRPLIASIEYKELVWDKNYNSKINKFLTYDEARKDFSGEETTEKYKNQNTLKSLAFEYCIDNKNKIFNSYFPALGEMLEMLNNAIYLNAAVELTGIGFKVDTSGWYWSSSEYGEYGSWFCRLTYGQVRCGWYYKRCSCRVVRFFAKKK